MADKTAPNKPVDLSKLSFEALKKRFDNQECNAETFIIATWMARNYPQQASELLPFNIHIDGNSSRFDFNRDQQTTSYEWASALYAAKIIREESKGRLETMSIDNFTEEAGKIYRSVANATKRKTSINSDESTIGFNSCARL